MTHLHPAPTVARRSRRTWPLALAAGGALAALSLVAGAASAPCQTGAQPGASSSARAGCSAGGSRPAPLGFAAATADFLRVHVGPAPVAWLEGAGSAMLDSWAQLEYQLGVRPAPPWQAAPQPPAGSGSPDASTARAVVASPTPAPKPAATPGATPRATATARPSPTPTPRPTAAPTPPVLGSVPLAPPAGLPPLPGEGVWTSAGLPEPAGATSPVLLKTFIRPDPIRPYAEVVLLKIDLRRARLHLVAGTVEPGGAARPGRGAIPPADAVAGRLLAAFNGGFKAINGHFGMVVGSTTYQALKPGLATVAIYPDGSVRMGAWGVDFPQSASGRPVAVRQNGPLLLRNGQLTQRALADWAWGQTITTSAYTWRSGLGMTRNGNLVYAVGPSLTARTLGEALRTAGAVTAMQLDINPFWVRAVTYGPDGAGNLVPSELWSRLYMDPRQFLAPYGRDFFYVTAAPTGAAGN